MKIGTTAITAAYAGTVAITSVYIGTTLVWTGVAPITISNAVIGTSFVVNAGTGTSSRITRSAALALLEAADPLPTQANWEDFHDSAIWYDDVQILRAAANVSLSNATGVQNVFGASNNSVSLEASSTYIFEAIYSVQSGTTSHTTNTAFAGTATLQEIQYAAFTSPSTVEATMAATSSVFIETEASTATNAATTGSFVRINLHGIVRTTGAGTFIPQVAYSAAPGTTTQVLSRSYFRIYKIGDNNIEVIGLWA